MRVSNPLSTSGLQAGVVFAHDVTIRPGSPALAEAVGALVARRAAEDFPPPELKDGVRTLLKKGGFKPSGRNKPASEYLAQAAREGRFPTINNLVDVNNLLSLTTGFPISLLDCAPFGEQLTLRFGREGESYVFNSAGQVIDLKGLICACGGADERPLGNPVKDSMTGKITDATKDVVAVVYAPAGFELASHLETFADWLKREGGASKVHHQLC